MRSSTIGLIGFAVFLSVYGFVKYSAAAPPVFVAAYAQNVAILVALTGVVPFIVCLGVARMMSGALPVKLVVSAFVGVVVCVGAYALFFKLFIEGAAPGVNLVDVAKRGIGWGAIEGALAALTAGGVRRAA